MASSRTTTAKDRPRHTELALKNVLDVLDCDDSDIEDYVEDSEDHDWEDQPSSQESDSDRDNSEELRPANSREGISPGNLHLCRWRKKDFQPKDSTFLGAEYSPPPDMKVKTALEYFRMFVTDSMIENIVQQTNLYSMQKCGKSPINTTRKEIEQAMGMYFKMGLAQMSRVRQYWESATAYQPVCSVMSRNRFRLLLTCLHFVDNLKASNETKKDKLWKVRPWLDKVRENCLKLIPDEHCAVGEMVVRYTGKTSPIRQYIGLKTHPWGFKVWSRVGVNGILYDFDVNVGADGTRTELSPGANAVLRLTKTLQPHCNYKIYAGNLFTSLPLIAKLAEHGIFYTGTVSNNHLPECGLKEEKDLKKEGRGAFDYTVEQNNNVACVRWFDNKAVTLLSSFIGVSPLSEARRWDKTVRDHHQIPMPALIHAYNRHMGGIDLLDSFLERFRFPMKSKRWYLYLYWHFLSVSLINAWSIYRRDCQLAGLSSKQTLSRRNFQAEVADGLIKVNAEKRGQPAAAGDAPTPPMRKRRKTPSDNVRYDGYCHWPVKADKRGRCKLCDGTTKTVCEKCELRLCFLEERNCFKGYHQK